MALMGVLSIVRWSSIFPVVHALLSQDFSDDRALEYAKLAGAAYCSPDDLAKWDCGSKCTADVTSLQYCEGNSTNAYVAIWERRCLVSFMGSKEYESILTDLEIFKHTVKWDVCQNCSVHDGFLYEWQSLEQCVKKQLIALGCPSGSYLPFTSILVTGHSLGAALTAIAMMALDAHGWSIHEAYMFGMPRVGDEQFAAKFNDLFKDKFFRVTHHMDPVVQLPPSWLPSYWRHVEPEIFYDGVVAAGHQRCEADGDVNCSGQYAGLFPIAKDFLLHAYDHENYMDIWIGGASCRNPSSTRSVRQTDAVRRNTSLVV